MRLLMTGGYGCIGSWIATRLVERGDEVWIYDLKRDTHRLDWLLRPEAQAGVHFLAGDVTDPNALRAAVEQVGATHLLHLAGLQVPVCRATPIVGATVNVIGTLAVFEVARELGDQIARVVYASSAAVHGPAASPVGQQTPPLGDDVPLKPSTHYGAFKVCNELNARVYYQDHGISSVGLRPWTVYGVGRDFGVTSEPTTAILASAMGRPYAISYGGWQDFQYARDVADTFLSALEGPFQGAAAFNVRGHVEPIERFVEALESVAPEAIGRVTHGDRQLPIAPDLDDEGLRLAFPDVPRTPLAEGVGETYRRFRTLIESGQIDASALS